MSGLDFKFEAILIDSFLDSGTLLYLSSLTSFFDNIGSVVFFYNVGLTPLKTSTFFLFELPCIANSSCSILFWL